MPELLLELMSEEIPARMQAGAAAELSSLAETHLAKAGLPPADTKTWFTARRLTLLATGLPAVSRAARVERKGPRVDAPDAAVEGFLRSTGLRRENLEVRDVSRGKRGKPVRTYFAVIEEPGRPAGEVAAEVLPAVVRGLTWPNSMRWGEGEFRWVRPLSSVLCILFENKRTASSQVVPFSIAGLQSGNRTCGHRFLAPDGFEVGSFEGYRRGLRDARVMLDRDDRISAIRDQAIADPALAGLDIVNDRALLEEIAGLVEWPVVLVGDIAEDFLDLPADVLRVSMREHQKFLSCRNRRTGRIEKFVTVANLATHDNGETILAGNRKVLYARLSDAKFHWENDLRVARSGMADWLDRLPGVMFHHRLGSQAERVARIARLASVVAPRVGADAAVAECAARHAKADLLSDMVQEFPELQGCMGRHYALAAGLGEDVARACEEHYAPRASGEPAPSAPVSVALALAERVDMLTSFWAIGEKPTGSKDPFALRRSALGVIRILIENGIRIPLLDLLRLGADDPGADCSNLLGFFHDRLKVHLRDRGIAHDVIDACRAMGGSDDLVLLVRRTEALDGFLGTSDGESLLHGYRRANNILSAEEARDGVSYELAPEPRLVREDAERALFDALAAAETEIRPALEAEDFVAAMTAMSRLRGPVDAFFDTVTVNAGDSIIRRNRLCLLNRVREVICRVAAFSEIGG